MGQLRCVADAGRKLVIIDLPDYTEPVNHYRLSILRATLLILVLAFGPLQARTLFACAMMGTSMLDECCCEAHTSIKDCIDAECDGIVDSGGVPCCEISVQISVDDDARQDTPIVKTAHIRSDVDPPQVIAASFPVPVLSPSLLTTAVFPPPFSVELSASDTYLVTQRLRL
jgi:hypothetical protein